MELSVIFHPSIASLIGKTMTNCRILQLCLYMFLCDKPKYMIVRIKYTLRPQQQPEQIDSLSMTPQELEQSLEQITAQKSCAKPTLSTPNLLVGMSMWGFLG